MSTLSPSDVTVVIPARNAERTLARTLSSILDSHRGAAPHVTIVDDGSTDGTCSVAGAAGATVRVLHTAGVGPGAARNVGIAAADTPYIAFCDADDCWPPDRLAHDLALFAARPSAEVVLGRTRFDADDPGLLEGLHFERDDRTAVIPHFGAATMRREVFASTGPVLEGTANFEDYDWFLRVREVGAELVVHDDVALWRTMHRGSMSRRNPPNPTDLLVALQRSIIRRRREGTATTPLPRLSDLRLADQHLDPAGGQR